MDQYSTCSLNTKVQLWPTPAKSEPGWKNLHVVDKAGLVPQHPNQRFYDAKTGRCVQKGLEQIVLLFPTPRASKTGDEDEAAWMARKAAGKVSTPPLSLAVRMLPTPTTQDANNNGSPTCNAHPGTTLTDYVREDGGTGRQDAQPDPPKLNPEWVELLMGWPRGWTQVDGYTAPRGRRAGRTTARASSPENPPTAQTD
jgi:hypothetical protein